MSIAHLGYLGTFSTSSSSSQWTRPSGWLTMPATNPDQIDILTAVTNDSSNYVALNISVSTGTYTVNWGDGTSAQTYTSGTTASYQYNWSNISNSTLAQWGYRQALIQITPTTGGANITGINLGAKNSATGLGSYAQPWLDVQINASSCTSISMSTTISSEWVQRVNIIAIGSVTSLASTFNGCSALQSVSFPSGSLASVTSLANTFNGCSALQSVSFPSGSLASVTSLANTFQSCDALQSISFPSGSLASVTSLASTFNGCSALQSVSFPSGSLASVTSLGSTFAYCYALQSVSFPSGSLASVTSLASTFQSCNALQSISFPSGSLASVTSLGSTFAYCYALQSVSFPSGSLASVTSLASTFMNCSALQSVSFPSGSLASVTSTTSCFTSCGNLSFIGNCSIPVTFSVASCCLAGAELNAIFSALPIAVAQTITVTGNHGVNDVGYSTLAATTSGWTVTN